MGEKEGGMNDHPIPIRKESGGSEKEASKGARILAGVLLSVMVLSLFVPLSIWLTRLALGG